MKDCSAYCEPEKGVHVHLGWTNTHDLEALREEFVGRRERVRPPGADESDACYPTPAYQTVLAIDPAAEAGDRRPSDAPVPILVRVFVEQEGGK